MSVALQYEKEGKGEANGGKDCTNGMAGLAFAQVKSLDQECRG